MDIPQSQEEETIPQDLLELTKTIPKIYFNEENFDETRYWLSNLPSENYSEHIEKELDKYKEAYKLVLSKIVSKVLDNHTKYSKSNLNNF